MQEKKQGSSKKFMKTFMLSIITDLKTIFSGQAEYCSIVTVSGSMGFEAYHEPFLGVLQDNSELSYTDSNGKIYTVALESGIISFKDNACTITGIIAL